MPYDVIKDDEIVQTADYFEVWNGGVLKLSNNTGTLRNPSSKTVGVYAPGTWDYVFPTKEE